MNHGLCMRNSERELDLVKFLKTDGFQLLWFVLLLSH
jgi:hypothetical protein